jgi:hypothetical protein
VDIVSLVFMGAAMLAAGAWAFVFIVHVRAHRAWKRGEGPADGYWWWRHGSFHEYWRTVSRKADPQWDRPPDQRWWRGPTYSEYRQWKRSMSVDRSTNPWLFGGIAIAVALLLVNRLVG